MPGHAPLALLALALVASPLHVPRSASPVRVERVRTDDNLRPAGSRRGGVLRLRLDVRTGMWYPDGDDAQGMLVPAFAEAGRPLQIPGPLIRVPAGTDVVVTLANHVGGSTLTVHGLVSRPAARGAADTVQVAAGGTREVRFRLDSAGTFYYWGTTTGRAFLPRTHEDAQLSGAIVVDPPGAGRPRDRILVIGMIADTTPSEFVPEEAMQHRLLVVNGRSWPHTERLAYAVGDTVRFRVVNASAAVHPMHLHGFYFDVDSRGDGTGDTAFAHPRKVVTEFLTPGATMLMTWVPERAGNWLFHCHIPAHFSRRGPLGARLPDPGGPHAAHVANHALEAMNGLVVGVVVAPSRAAAHYASAPEPVRRHLRLLARPNAGGSDSLPLYGFALVENGPEPPPDSGLHVGPPIVLVRGEPVSIMVVNRLPEETAVHWHGIELESYFDGVSGFSGSSARLSPAIAPADSFEARFTPPRAGTFIYHTHIDELRQQPAGLAGALIVLEPGQPWDPATDIPVLITSPRDPREAERAAQFNGALRPAPLELRAGVAYRLRFINITTNRPGVRLELRRDTTLLAWRVLAKDGADLPAERQIVRPARQPISIGETVDIELTPAEPGDLRILLRTPSGSTVATMEVRVR